MKILAFSDSHGRLPKIDPSTLDQIDCIMIAGDVCPSVSYERWVQEYWFVDGFFPWVEKFGKPVYLTLGNHDFLDVFDAPPPNLFYGTETVFDDVMIFSWTQPFNAWAWAAEEDVIAEKLKNLLAIDTKPSIWLTHSPPWGICDGSSGYCLGSSALRQAIMLHQPRLVICGHIHQAAGVGSLWNTKVYNVAITGVRNVWGGNPVIIDI